jgi:uncharacterized protein YcsI (UPF0317 family)
MLTVDKLNEVRSQIRSGCFQKNTSGLMPNLVQGNLVIMPQQWADEFIQFCRLNPKPCPLIGISEPGNPSIPELGYGLDIRIDVPEYHLYTPVPPRISKHTGKMILSLSFWVVLFLLRVHCSLRD